MPDNFPPTTRPCVRTCYLFNSETKECEYKRRILAIPSQEHTSPGKPCLHPEAFGEVLQSVTPLSEEINYQSYNIFPGYLPIFYSFGEDEA